MAKPILFVIMAIPAVLALLIMVPLLTETEIPSAAVNPNDTIHIEYTKHDLRVISFGVTEKIVNRKGAKSNHVIIASGPFGYTGAGLSILLKNKKCSKKFGAKAKRAVFKPNCRLMFGLKNKNYFSSSMDSSDGLSTTLNEMSSQSKKKFE